MSRKHYIGIVFSGIFIMLLVSCNSSETDEPLPPPEDISEPAAAEATEVPESNDVPEPAPTAETIPTGPYVRINNISLDGSVYNVEYETFEYTEVLPGMHVHFFFNSVTPEQAGVGGDGPWYVWGGPRPFNGYTTDDRGAASQMCALVANANHTIVLNTGNCYDLPLAPAG